LSAALAGSWPARWSSCTAPKGRLSPSAVRSSPWPTSLGGPAPAITPTSTGTPWPVTRTASALSIGRRVNVASRWAPSALIAGDRRSARTPV